MQAMPALSIKDLDPRHERLLAVVIILLSLGAIGATLWRYLPAWLEPGPLAETGAAAQPEAALGARSRASLSDYGLFGAAPGGDSPGQLALAMNAPQTSLDLSLHGTLATKDPDGALAIIADGEGVERAYAVGAELPGNAVLYRVYRDRAILRRAGELETLPLRDPEREAASGTAGAGETGTARERSASGRASRDELARAAERLRNDPAQLARQFSAVPVQEDGRLIGVRLRANDDSALLSRVGLRGSDIVTAVNGVPVNDFSRANEVMSQLQGSTEFQVTVLRNGQEQQINVSLNE